MPLGFHRGGYSYGKYDGRATAIDIRIKVSTNVLGIKLAYPLTRELVINLRLNIKDLNHLGRDSFHPQMDHFCSIPCTFPGIIRQSPSLLALALRFSGAIQKGTGDSRGEI